MSTGIYWELVNPEGVFNIKPLTLNPHPKTLDGKSILLRWNGKHNGDVFLNRVAEHIAQKFNGVRFIRNWEVAPETTTTVWQPEMTRQFTKTLADLKPDIVIGAQAD